MEFFVACRPTTKGNHKAIVRGRGGRPMLIGSSAARAAEAELVGLLLPHAPAEPFTGPVRVDLTALLPIPKCFTSEQRLAANAGLLWPSKRGTIDRSNFPKLVDDALQAWRGKRRGAGFVVDDAQICAGEISKRYARDGEVPGYWFRIQELAS